MMMPIKAAVLEMAGMVGEARQEIRAERGRIDNLAGFVLPQLGATVGAVEEVRKQMTEQLHHRAGPSSWTGEKATENGAGYSKADEESGGG